MRKLLILTALAACGPGDRGPTPETPDANTLPAGVWEPDPGTGRVDALVARSGDGIWFAYRRVGSAAQPIVGTWLTKTTADGQPLVAPIQIEPTTLARRAIAATDSSLILASLDDSSALIRRFDQAGIESNPATVALGEDLGGPFTLVAKPSGVAKLVAAGSVHEIVTVDVDGATPPTTIGTRDVMQTGTVAATFAPSGALVVGWDRIHDRCHGYVPFTSLAVVVHDDGVAEAPTTVRDLPDHSEYGPALTPSFAVWQQDDDATNLTSVLAVAPLDDLSTVYNVGDPEGPRMDHPLLAEESPGRAAIAWLDNGHRKIAALVRDASGVRLGVSHEIPKVHEVASPSIGGLVSVGNGRYLVTWSESVDTPSFGPDVRQYAMTFDLSNDPLPRLAPPAPMTPSTPRVMPRIAPCD